MEHANQIQTWFNKKTKLYKRHDLDILRKYLNEIDKSLINKNIINFSSDIEFVYYDCNIDNIRPENIFKLNWYYIIKRMKKLFQNVKIKINYECPSIIETDIKEKRTMCYQHDVYITIRNNNVIYDYVLEYFETKSHNIKKDTDKQICTTQYVNIYSIYKEKQNLYDYMKSTIHNLLVLVCAAINDPFQLSKVNFFKNHNNKLTLKKDTELFNKIISIKQNNKFHFEEFFESMNPKNGTTGDYFELDEFIEFIEDNYNIKIELDDDGNCSYKTFSKLIISLDKQVYSKYIQDYKKIYQYAMDILFDSQKQIIDFIKIFNEKKTNLPDFINFFFLNHIQNYKNKNTLSKVRGTLNEIIKDPTPERAWQV